MTDLYDSKSIGDRGTLYQIKVYLNQMGANLPVMSHFQHVWDLFQVRQDSTNIPNELTVYLINISPGIYANNVLKCATNNREQ